MWDRFDAMTDDEIIEAAADDPDSFVPTEEELKRFKRARTEGFAESEATYCAPTSDETSVVLALLYVVLTEISAGENAQTARRLAEAVHNASLRLMNEDGKNNTIEVIRTRAAKLGVAAEIDGMIAVARRIASPPKD